MACFSKWDIGRCGCTSPPTQICITTCTSPSYIVVGALVQLFTGATLVASCTTGSTGCCTFTQSGTYTVKVTISGTLESTSNRTLSGTTITINVTDPDVICCGGYMIPQTLTLTDAVGTCTLAWAFGTTWQGSILFTHSSTPVIFTSGTFCGPGTSSSGTICVSYAMVCNTSSSPHFTLTRTWSVLSPGSSPDYFQAPVAGGPGYNECSCGGTLTCTGGPTTSCDTAVDHKDPTSSSPFAIAFSPVASAFNVLADPVGGSVAIS